MKKDELPIVMFDDNHPTDWIDRAITWVMNHVLATAFVIATAVFWLGVFTVCFGG